MSKERHTPGPWKFVAGDIVDSASNTIAQVHGVAYIHGNANGRLIAEAPAMLALLKEVLKEHVFYEEPETLCDCAICVTARAIVARIEG